MGLVTQLRINTGIMTAVNIIQAKQVKIKSQISLRKCLIFYTPAVPKCFTYSRRDQRYQKVLVSLV
jgi:hypothetical protein